MTGAEFCGLPVLSLMVKRRLVPGGVVATQVMEVLVRSVHWMTGVSGLVVSTTLEVGQLR
jgi:hypothetical protein